jgi:hypothetical protein
VLLTKCYLGDKTKSLRWAGHVACAGIRVMHTEFSWGNQNVATHGTGPGNKRGDNINNDVKEVRWQGID